jgi:peptide/nickel transport system substrate-binding protein
MMVRTLMCRVTVGFVVASFVVAGQSAGASTATAGEPQQGGTLTIAKPVEQGNGWDPIKLIGIPTAGEAGQNFAFYDALFLVDHLTGKLSPRIGVSLTSSDSTTWTLKLRPNVKFSDGTPFDADAVKFNWERIADPANKASSATAANVIQNYTVVDPLTLRVTLNAPNPVWNQVVATRLAWIGSPTAIKASGATYGSKPVGAGPFVLKEWVRDNQYTLVKNPTYWEKGHPYLDQVIVKIIIDPLTAYDTFKSGGADINHVLDPTLVGTAQADKVKLFSVPVSGGGWALSMNNQTAPFNDVRVRQAFNIVIDRKQFNNVRRNGDPSTLMDTVQAKGSPYYDPKNSVPKYDLTAGQKLIDSYIADQGGKPINVTILTFNTPYITQDAQLLQQMFQKLKGVTVNLDVQSAPSVVAKAVAGQYQAYFNPVWRWNEPALDFINLFLGGSSLNYMRYSNSTVDSALNQLRTAADPQVKKQLVSQATAQIIKDAPVAYYSRYSSSAVIAKRVRGLKWEYDLIELLDNAWVTNK